MGFQERFSDLLKWSKVPQAEIARALNIRASTLSDYKSGRIMPSADVLIRISNYYKVSVDWLLLEIERGGYKVETFDNDPLPHVYVSSDAVFAAEKSVPYKSKDDDLEDDQAIELARLIRKLPEDQQRLLRSQVDGWLALARQDVRESSG